MSNDFVNPKSEKRKREAEVADAIVRDALNKANAGDMAGAGKELASLAPASTDSIKKKHPAFIKKVMKKLEEETGVSFETTGRKAMLSPDATKRNLERLQESENEEIALKAVELDYRAYMAAINATAKAKQAPQQNVQVNVDRRGIAVNGMRNASSAPSSEPSPPKPRPTIHYFDSPPETASKSPSDQGEERK